MAPATQTTVLKTAIATYPHTKGLKDGTVTAPGIEFEHVEITPIIAAFRRMCRRLEFDVAEMAITTYLTAKAYNKPFTALPVFVVRQFHPSPIVYNVKSGVTSPKDLEGKKVGVRAYTVTTGVWARGILATEYGVDLSKVTWVLADEEHVEEYHKAYPSNVVYQAGAVEAFGFSPLTMRSPAAKAILMLSRGTPGSSTRSTICSGLTTTSALGTHFPAAASGAAARRSRRWSNRRLISLCTRANSMNDPRSSLIALPGPPAPDPRASRCLI